MWEHKIDVKPYCSFIICVIYLEENMSLKFFKNIYQTYVPTQFLYDTNERKNKFFQETFDYFNKKNKYTNNYFFTPKDSEMKLRIGIKNNEKKDKDSQRDLSVFIQNDNIMNNLNINFEKEQYSISFGFYILFLKEFLN